MFRRRVQVFVHDEPYTITVSGGGGAVWTARGRFMATSLTVEDETEQAAMKRWRLIAESAEGVQIEPPVEIFAR
jgi:hypothetical protein